MNQGLVGGPRQEGFDDIGVGDVKQLVALPGEVSNVIVESFLELLLAIL